MPWRRVRHRSSARRMFPWMMATAVLVSLALACLQDIQDRENLGPIADGSSESSVSGPAHFKRVLLPAVVSHNPRRLIYPYSVIPGGVRSVQELKLAILADHSIASHYSAFDFSKFRIIRLEAEKTAYVAYRVHNEIFWTKKKLKLRTGEELITDGVHYARLRCGNLISEDDPHGETSPKEPPPDLLDTPLNSNLVPPERKPVPIVFIPPPDRHEFFFLPPPIDFQKKHIRAVELGEAGQFAAVLVGLVGYFVVRRRHTPRRRH